MIRAAIGISTERNTVRAALEAASQAVNGFGGSRPDWCIVFVSAEHREHLAAMLEAVSGALETPYVTGCSTSGVVCPAGEIDAGPVIGLLAVASDRMQATPFLFHDDGDQGMTAGVRLGQRLAASRGSDDLLLVLPDPFSVRPDHLLRALDAVLGPLPVVGGAPSAAPAGVPTFQFCGSEYGESAVSGLRLGGDFHYRVGITHGSIPLGPPARVTRAHDAMLLELDGRAACEVLRDVLPDGADLVESAQGTLFVGILDDPEVADRFMVRNVVSADPDTGIVVVADTVEEGQHVVFLRRDANAARGELTRLLEELTTLPGGVDYRFALYFDCVARGRSLYGEPHVDATILARYLPETPFLGMYSNAEIGPLDGENRLLTYSGVLLLVGD